MTLLFETARDEHWLPFERPHISSNTEVNVNSHKPPCAHKESPVTGAPHPFLDPITLHNKRDAVQRGVVAFCGLAGLYPNPEGGKPDFGHVQFHGLLAEISFVSE